LLGWQFDQATEISKQLGEDPPRDDYTEVAEAVVKEVPNLPLQELLGEDLTASLRSCFESHLAFVAHGEAAVVSFDRYGWARKARNREWMAKQAEAVLRHKKAMAPHLRTTADALEQVWRTADSFTPTGHMPEEMLTQLSAPEMDFARSLGIDDSAIQVRSDQIASGQGGGGDPEIAAISDAYRKIRRRL
jgi:hypothetical protein